MKNQFWKRLLCAGLISCLALGGLAGCGEEQQIDYNIEGVAEETQAESNSGKSAVSQFADETSWSDSWITEGERITVDVTVEAQVYLPDTEEMVVVEVSVPEFDAAFKERVVQTLFEEGAVYDNDTDNYIGERNGMTYELWFSDAYGDAGWHVNSQYFSLSAVEFEEFCPDEAYTIYQKHPYMAVDRYSETGENACELSQEEAEKQARGLLEDLGLEYPVLAYTIPLMWGDETLSTKNMKDWSANGYVFTYEYGLDDISFTGFGANDDYTGGAYSYTIGELVPYSMAAFAEVYVTDKGIIALHVNCPVETVGISESVEMLPLDTIKGIMEAEAEKAYENAGGSWEVEHTHLELIYFRVRDKEDMRHYSYVPAWRLSEQIGVRLQGNLEIRDPLMVNAIDGSWIDVGDELGPKVIY